MARRLRRYKFTGLPRLTREQARVLNAMMAYLPQTAFESDFKDKLRQVIEPLVHADIDLWFDGITHVDAGKLTSQLCDPTCVALVGMLPKGRQMLVEVDLTVAQQAVDRMLGGSAEDVDGQRPLSEIEEGVFSFILLKALALLQEGAAAEHQLALKLNGVLGSHDELAGRVPDDTAYLCVGFKLFFDLAVGFLRVYLPEEIIKTELAAPRPLEGPAFTRKMRRLAVLAPRIATMKVPLRVEVGRIPFSVADLQALDTGDIILVEDPQVHLSSGSLTGQVNAFIGKGHHGTIRGSLAVGEAGAYEVVIDQILPGAEPPSTGALSQERGQMDEEYARDLPRVDEARAREIAAGSRRVLEERARTLPRPLATAPEGPLDEEHSESEYEEGEYEEGAYEEEPLPESANMLEDVAVAMVVELGRVSVSAADVMGLRPGQVIELSRSPGDPVDLVVDGKRLGKGELVEIEGELGVRILELVK